MAPPPLPARSSPSWIRLSVSGCLGLAMLAACSSTPASGPADVAATRSSAPPSPAATPAAPVTWGGPRAYEVEELTPIINRALKAGGRDFERGKSTFQMLSCPVCHHFGEGVGGIGPDISGVGGRMGTDGILTEILEPSKYISDLFGTKTVTTKSGETFTGRMLGNDANFVTLAQNINVDPTTMSATWEGGPLTKIKASDVDTIEESGISPMPAGLINGLKEDQIADLLAFLISGGDPANRMFRPVPATSAAPAAK